MKKVVKNCTIDYRVLNIRENTPILNYLIKNIDIPSFRLQHIDEETFKLLSESDKLIDISYGNFIAGYSNYKKGDNFRSSGGLKLSDNTENVLGSFVVENKRIIYTPDSPAFFDERDSYVYAGRIYYTTMSMPEVLAELLKRKRELLVYMGSKIENTKYVDIFDEITKDEMMEYAINPEKGKLLLQRKKYF